METLDLFSPENTVSVNYAIGADDVPTDTGEDPSLSMTILDIPALLGKSPDPKQVIRLMEVLEPGEPFINRWGNVDFYIGESIKGQRLYMDVRKKHYSMINEAFKQHHNVGKLSTFNHKEA